MKYTLTSDTLNTKRTIQVSRTLYTAMTVQNSEEKTSENVVHDRDCSGFVMKR